MAKEKQQKAPKEGKGAPETAHHEQERGAPPRLFEAFKASIIPELMKKFAYGNIMEVPKLEKISINVGVGQATQDAKVLDSIVKDLETIVGQKVVTTKSKKAISNFKLREGLPIGARVTLRSRRM